MRQRLISVLVKTPTGIRTVTVPAIPRSRMGSYPAGFVNNYWQGRADQKAQYVLRQDRLLGPQFVPASMAGYRRGYRGVRGLGRMGDVNSDPTNAAYDPGSIDFSTPDPSGFVVTDAAPVVYDSGGSGGMRVTRPQPRPQPTAWDQFVQFMSQPISPGSSIRPWHLMLGVGALAIATKRGRR